MTQDTTAPAEVLDLLDRFFAAVQAGDADTVASIYADDVEVWHNLTGRTVDKAGSLAILRWFMAPGVERSYEIHERLLDGGRVAQRHTLRVTVPDQPVVTMPVSIFITVADGRITRIDEYTDQAGTDALIASIPRS